MGLLVAGIDEAQPGKANSSKRAEWDDMDSTRQKNIYDAIVFALLVAIGVAGRAGQPMWEFTPIAAVTIFAGYHFGRLAVAALVPLAILGIGDVFLLPAHDSVPVIIATYAAMALPVLLGRWLRQESTSKVAKAARWAVCGLVPATIFWIASNAAVWAFQSDYAKTLAGLVECYWAAVPFYRWMLSGDVFYLTVLFVCLWLAGALAARPVVAVERAR